MDIGAARPIRLRIGLRPIMMESDTLKAFGTASTVAASTTIIGIATVTATSIMITIAGSRDRVSHFVDTSPFSLPRQNRISSTAL